MLDDDEYTELRDLTVAVILDVRSIYLRDCAANPLKHWEQIATRMRSAAMVSVCFSEWITRFMKGLGIVKPDVTLSEKIVELNEYVTTHGPNIFLQLIEREHVFLIALAQVNADARRESRKELSEKYEIF